MGILYQIWSKLTEIDKGKIDQGHRFYSKIIIKGPYQKPFSVNNWRISMTNVNPRDISKISKHISQKNDNFDKSRNKNLILTKVRDFSFEVS